MIENENNPDDKPKAKERPLFLHPPWMVGIVLVLGVWTIIAGFSDPVWFLLGLPFVLVLVLYIFVRITTWNRNGK